MSALSSELRAKEAALEARLRDAGRVLVAFSGGVESSSLAFAAHRLCGIDRAFFATRLGIDLLQGRSLLVRESS